MFKDPGEDNVALKRPLYMGNIVNGALKSGNVIRPVILTVDWFGASEISAGTIDLKPKTFILTHMPLFRTSLLR